MKIARLNISLITRRWPDGVMALDNISLSIGPGELIAVIGPSGSGKSTLLRVISGLDTADSGTIENSLGRRGIVFQQSSLFIHLTVLANVAMPLRVIRKMSRAESESIAVHELNTWGLAARSQAYPSELSSGEQQRAALARTLAMQPGIICLDEITSALDPEATQEIIKRVHSLRASEQAPAIVMATHDISVVRCMDADSVLFLDHGRAVEYGAAEELLESPKSERLSRFLDAYYHRVHTIPSSIKP